jgi:hypothetical protein
VPKTTEFTDVCGVIAWHDFSWEAFATLTTGVLAVAAAIVVGLRQLSILAAQARLEELKLRSDLYDRRYEVFQAARNWIGFVFRTGRAPDIQDEEFADFMLGIQAARFLFSKKVVDELTSWHEMGARMRLLTTQNKHAEATNVKQDLIARGDKMYELFGGEMSVSQPRENDQAS